jgi:hypothetical protein
LRVSLEEGVGTTIRLRFQLAGGERGVIKENHA